MLKNTIRIIALAILTVATCFSYRASAEGINAFSLSPMHQMVTLTPGESYYGNFNIVNPGTSVDNFYYTLSVKPFTTTNDGDVTATENGDHTLMADWIEILTGDGVVAPNESDEIRFVINVPENAPAGGQYAMIAVKSSQYRVDNSSVDLRENYESGHLIYADVAGETVRKGKITDVVVPSFLFSGKIFGSAITTNEGNVHSQSTQTLQIFPLFSKEEVFTNEEEPKKGWIMPGNSSLSKISWENTPKAGIFHVIYSVEYEGVESKIDKYVIVCPLWLLIVLLTCLFVVIFSIVFGKKKDKKGRKN